MPKAMTEYANGASGSGAAEPNTQTLAKDALDAAKATVVRRTMMTAPKLSAGLLLSTLVAEQSKPVVRSIKGTLPGQGVVVNGVKGVSQNKGI
jgi:hypothetical protein